MILADTSIWVDHLRSGNRRLHVLLEEGNVSIHPFIVGELACGSLRNRDEILALLSGLPPATVAGHEEVLGFVAQNSLHGKGIGWIDVHLLASALLDGVALWTLDKRLSKIAQSLGITP